MALVQSRRDKRLFERDLKLPRIRRMSNRRPESVPGTGQTSTSPPTSTRSGANSPGHEDQGDLDEEIPTKYIKATSLFLRRLREDVQELLSLSSSRSQRSISTPGSSRISLTSYSKTWAPEFVGDHCQTSRLKKKKGNKEGLARLV